MENALLALQINRSLRESVDVKRTSFYATKDVYLVIRSMVVWN
jgi:hypothetical protein